MKKLLTASFLSLSLCSVGAFAAEMTGYISDAHCGAKHSSPSAANTKCVKDMCIKGGADPVLVSEGKVMKFDDESKEKAKEFAGDNVKIDGTMDGDTIKVSSIQKAE
ncbi:MAG TPA: hypothetical protein VH601_16065 [Bryobacteraceae bacterium]